MSMSMDEVLLWLLLLREMFSIDCETFSMSITFRCLGDLLKKLAMAVVWALAATFGFESGRSGS